MCVVILQPKPIISEGFTSALFSVINFVTFGSGVLALIITGAGLIHKKPAQTKLGLKLMLIPLALFLIHTLWPTFNPTPCPPGYP